MDTRTIAEVWDHRRTYLFEQEAAATIGVNWAAVGPVRPDTARRFAKRLLQAAETAERRIAAARRKGCEIVNPEK